MQPAAQQLAELGEVARAAREVERPLVGAVDVDPLQGHVGGGEAGDVGGRFE